jgi:hypothetical protein
VAVMATASDASLCKLSASSLGYFEDAFVQFFVKSPSRRMPIINRGYYARVAAIESVVTRFVAAHNDSEDSTRKTQIVILGAGLDTMFFRLKQRGALPASCEYFEMDFADVTLQKVMTIRRRKQLMSVLGLESAADLQAAASAGNGFLSNSKCRHVLGYLTFFSVWHSRRIGFERGWLPSHPGRSP